MQCRRSRVEKDGWLHDCNPSKPIHPHINTSMSSPARCPTCGGEIGSMPDNHRYCTADTDVSMWPTIIKYYSRRSLSEQPDKLDAISGLANTIKAQMLPTEGDTRYAAGMFIMEALPHHLLWRAVQPGEIRNQNVPTWSWLAINGAIDFDLEEEIVLKPKLVSCYSLAGGTELVLEGRSHTVKLVTVESHDNGVHKVETHARTGRGATLSVRCDLQRKADMTQSDDSASCWSTGEGAPHRCEKCKPFDYKYRAVLIARDTSTAQFLVLEYRSDWPNKGKWQRVGTGVYTRRLDQRWFDLFPSREKFKFRVV